MTTPTAALVATATALSSAVLRPPPPAARPDAVVVIGTRPAAGGDGQLQWLSPLAARALVDELARVRTGVFVMPPREAVLLIGGREQLVRQGTVSAELFDVLGVRPQFGRLTAGYVLVHATWHARFGGRPDILGTTVVPEAGSAADAGEIVGVMPPGFVFPLGVEIWRVVPRGRLLDVASGPPVLGLLARLPAGFTVGEARAAARSAHRRLPERDGRALEIQTLRDFVHGTQRDAAAALALACAGILLAGLVATLHLAAARAAAERRAVAIRLALGATPPLVVRQFLGEAGRAGAAALLLAIPAAAALIRLAAATLLPARPVSLTGPAVLAAAIVAGGFVAVTTLVLAIGTLRRRRGERMLAIAGPAPSISVRRVAVVAQAGCASAVVLVAAATSGGFLQAVTTARSLDAQQIVVVEARQPMLPADLRAGEYPYLRWLAEARLALDSLRSSLLIRQVALANPTPFSGRQRLLPCRLAARPDAPFHACPVVAVSPEYFGVMRLPVEDGRPLSSADSLTDHELRSGASARAGAAVVSRALARQLGVRGPGAIIDIDGLIVRQLQVVGIAADLLSFESGGRAEPVLYIAHAQFPTDGVTFLVRSAQPGALLASIRATLHGSRARLALGSVETLPALIQRRIGHRLATAVVVVCGSVAAVMLAAIGVAGLVRYIVAARRRDIALAVALGAGAAQIRRQFTGSLTGWLAAGGAVGAAVGWAAVRTTTSVSAEAPLQLAVDLAAALATMVFLAGLVSGMATVRGIRRIDPAVLLRE
ncbi:MAG TPA: FtsX-like permease family protein [Vicinamibacterales bacterium]|nr:FtsX-like permease family protein [Vicinamibacterales bacterium]